MANLNLKFTNLKLSNQTVTISIEPQYNLSYAHRLMFQRNTGIQLLERLFTYKHTYLHNVTDSLQISQATVYGLVKHINDQLNPRFGVKIQTNPFQLKGEESDIRAFFSQPYSNLYTPFEWPFINIDESAITELITKITDAIHFPLNYVGINYLKFLVAVNLVRLRQGHYAALDSDRAASIYQTIQSTDFMGDKTKQIMSRLGLSLNQHNVVQLFHTFINSDYIFSDSKITIRSHPTNQRIDSLNNLNYVVETLKSEFCLEIDNPSALILDLHNVAVLNRKDIDSENIIYESKNAFITDLSCHFPEFISRSYELFQEYCVKMDITADRFTINRLIHHLFIQWKTLYTQLVEKQGVIEVVIVCNYDANHAIFLKEYFELHFGKKVSFKIYDGKLISCAHLRKIPEPVILSTFHIPPIEGKFIVNINFFPSANDLDKVYDIFQRVIKNQENVLPH